jgi:hypothetical protein
MKLGRQEKKKLVDILSERSRDFMDRNGTHKEKWFQYLQMNGIMPQPSAVRRRKGMVILKLSLFDEGLHALPEELATKMLVLGFAPPRNKRKEKKVEYRLERGGRTIAVATTAESIGNKVYKFLNKARSDHVFTIFDPDGKILVKISKSKGIRSVRYGA